MNVVIIIFMVVATLFALASLAYVAFDLYMEYRTKKQAELVPEESAAPTDETAQLHQD